MIRALELINLFAAGIIAGLEIAIHYGFHGATLALPETAQLRLRQGMVRRLRWLVPAFFVPAMLSGLVLVAVDHAAPELYSRAVALAAMAVWIAIRVAGTVPINAATLTWDANAPPADWREQVAKAERFHVVGVWAAVLAFAGFLIAAAPA